MPATRQATIVGKRFGETHADARARRGREAHQECVMERVVVANAAANTGASVDTEPSINPAAPGCTICKTNRRRCARSSSCFTFAGSFSLSKFLRPLFVLTFFG
jgi:hypothetical protein